MKIILLICFLFCAFAENYNGFQLFEISFNSLAQQESFFSHFPRDRIDIWSNDQRIGNFDDNMEIMLNPIQSRALLALKSTFNFKTIISDVGMQWKIQQMEMTTKTSPIELTEQWYSNYHKYDEILQYNLQLKEKYPRFMERFELGQTVENRTIWGFTVHSPGAYNASKPGIWINSLQHAREWATIPTSQYAIWQILVEYSNGNPTIKHLLDNTNIHWVPVLNVDGFIYTHTNSRFWRKNRRGGFGVDLNRNWKAGWGSGSSDNRNSEVYRGPSPMSEPECQAVDVYLKKHSKQIKYGIDFHAYSEVLLRPYGKTRELSRDEARIAPLGQRVVNAVDKINNKGYRNWRAVQLGLGNGLDDEFYDTHEFAAGFTMEVRPRSAGSGGFHLQPAQILPNAKENFAGVIELLKILNKL